MADYKVTDTELTSIANAIRTKGGTQALLEFPTDFVSAINEISTGGGGGGTPIVPDEGTAFDSVIFSGAKNIELTNYSFNKYDEFELIYRKTGTNNNAWPMFFKVVGTNGIYCANENRYNGRKVINVSYGTTPSYIYSGDGYISIGNIIDNDSSVNSIYMRCIDDLLYFSYISYLNTYENNIYTVGNILVSNVSVTDAYNSNGLSNGTCYLFPTNNDNYFNGMVFYTFIIRRNNEVIHEYVPFDNDGTLALKDLITNDIIETEIELNSSAYTNDNTYYAEYGSTREAVLIEKTVTANGTYDASDDDADGYSQVVVNVLSPGGGGGAPTLQSKSVTPGASEQTISPDNGYDGLSAVTVAGDADLVAGNIKKDVNIFGVTGSYEGVMRSPHAEPETIFQQTAFLANKMSWTTIANIEI